MIDENIPECKCGRPEKLANDPKVPIEFDQKFCEYWLVVDRSRFLMRFCFWCGARLPRSNRDLYFTKPSATELAEVQELMKEARSPDDVVRLLGPADELCDSDGYCATRGDLYFSKWEQTYIYKTRWKTLQLQVPLVLEGRFHWIVVGHPLEQPRSLDS